MLANGESFSEAVLSICNQVSARKRQKNLVAVGINCIHPSHVTSLFKEIKKNVPTLEIPLVVYPNSGEIYTVEAGWHGKNDCIPLEDYIGEWTELGARFIGGCCRTNADDIRKIKQKVDKL